MRERGGLQSCGCLAHLCIYIHFKPSTQEEINRIKQPGWRPQRPGWEKTTHPFWTGNCKCWRVILRNAPRWLCMLPARRKKGGQMLRFRDRGGAENRRNSRTDYPFDRGEIPFYSICDMQSEWFSQVWLPQKAEVRPLQSVEKPAPASAGAGFYL